MNDFDGCSESEKYVRTHDFEEERGDLARNNITTYVRKIKNLLARRGLDERSEASLIIKAVTQLTN